VSGGAVGRRGERQRNPLAPSRKLVKVETGQTVHVAIAELERRPDVCHAELDWIYHTEATTNDPMFSRLWGAVGDRTDVVGSM
jgi:hypothetical protein